MLDPKSLLAIDAPPIAPYDDGFSTESDDLDGTEGLTDESHASPLHVAASGSVRRVAVAKSQPIQDMQQIPVTPAQKTAQQVTKDNSPPPIDIAPSIEEKASKQDAAGLNAATHDGDITKEEYCKGCKGYLTPLADILKAVQEVLLRHPGNGPLPSRQCSCCHITYPLVALTDESRSGACLQPRCYMCHWGAQVAKEDAVVGVKRTVVGALKTTNDGGRANGEQMTNMKARRVEPEERKEASTMDTRCSCRNCKGPLPSLHERLEVMDSTRTLLKTHGRIGSPPSRQCSCCYITYPLASLTAKSRRAACVAPICRWCQYTKAHPFIRRGQAGRSSTVAVDSSAEETRLTAAKPHESIDVEDGEDEGDRERVEHERC
jgi:hypothetical protein